VKLSAPFPRGEMRLQDKYLKLVHECLDQTSFSKAWSEDAAMSFEETIQYALAENEINTSPA
jgi:hypothetical protein